MKKLISGLIAIFIVSCSDMHNPKLHANYSPIEISILTELWTIPDVLWQDDWRGLWRMTWPGEENIMGYTEPESYHLDIYRKGASIGSKNILTEGYGLVTSVDFMGSRYRTHLMTGTHSFFVYNNDNTYVSIDGDYNATTLSNQYAQVVDSVMGKLRVTNEPEKLFSHIFSEVEIKDDLENFVLNEDNVYMLTLQDKVPPRVFVYLIEVELANNHRRVVSGGSMTVSGLADGVRLPDGKKSQVSTAHQFATHYEDIVTAAGTRQDADTLSLIGGRFYTFGATGKEANDFYVTLNYRNGGRRIIKRDISDQLRSLPTGGIVKIWLDMDSDELQPPEVTDTSEGGGFEFDISGWNDEDNVIKV